MCALSGDGRGYGSGGDRLGRAVAVLVVLMLGLGPLVQGAGVERGGEGQPAPPPIFDAPSVGPPPNARELLSNIDGSFTENKGQRGEGAGLFYCEGSPLSVAFGEGWVAYHYWPSQGERSVMFLVQFEGSNDVPPVGMDPMRHRSNFFIGNDEEGWVTGARNYRSLCYRGLYEGIDCVFRFEGGSLKYEFHVLPGADPTSIVMRYTGIDSLSIDERTRDLIISTPLGTLIDTHPTSFEGHPGPTSTVPSSFGLLDALSVSFQVSRKDERAPLIIDPGIYFCTFLGGNDWDTKTFLGVDTEGNIYAGTQSCSPDFPTTPGVIDRTLDYIDITISKLDKDGGFLHYSTFVGGSDEEISYCRNPYVDGDGNIIVAGRTQSTDFPTTSGAYDTSLGGRYDGFVFKLNATGAKLLFSTYLGGAGFEDCGGPVLLDENDNIIVVGTTASTDFPVNSTCYDSSHNGQADLFITFLDPTGSRIVKSTFIGGRWDESFAFSPRIAIGSDGSLFVQGMTTSPDFPVVNAFDDERNGGADIFVLRIDEDLQRLIYSTYIGGSKSDDEPWDFALDGNDNAIVVGDARSEDFPVTPGAYDTNQSNKTRAFCFKLRPSGDALDFSTFLSASDTTYGHAVTVLDEERILISGRTDAADFPITDNAYDKSFYEGGDHFLTLLDPNGTRILYSTFLRGSAGKCDAMVYFPPFIIMIGTILSSEMNTTAGCYDSTHNGMFDAFICSMTIEEINGTTPSSPQNLTLQVEDRSIHLEWDPPEYEGNLSLRGYRIYRGSNESALRCQWITPSSKHALDDRNVSMGRRYYYAVSAFNFFGEGNKSETLDEIAIGRPSTMDNLIATPGCGTVYLSWEPPSDTGGLSIDGYTLFKGIDHHELGLLVKLDNVTSYTDDGLTNGEEYFYGILAWNAMGESGLSEIVSATPTGPPSEPRFLTLRASDSRIELEWRLPIDHGGDPILGYHVYRGTSETSLLKIGSTTGIEVTFIDEDLTNGVTYYYSIQAYNGVGEGPFSSIVNGTPLGLPGAPRGLALESGDGYVSLSWDPPDRDGGTAILGYEILRGTSADTIASYKRLGAGTSSFKDTGLMNGETFFYRVSAYNIIGEGPPTVTLSATPLAPPDAPGDIAAQPGDRYVTVIWLAPQETGGAPLLEFRLYRGTSPDALEIMQTLAPSRLSHQDRDVVVGMEYYYKVAAVTIAGEGLMSRVTSATPYGPPSTPRDFTSRAGDREVRLSWSPPEDDGASPIEGYVILRGTSADNLRELVQLGDVHAYLDTSVSNGETYYYAIAAINEAGPGNRTDPVSATPLKPRTPPGRVLTLVGDAKGAKVTLQWTKPSDDGGSPVTGYVVYRGDSMDGMSVVATLGPVTAWTDDGVERGRTYYYSVAALNDVSEGEAFAPYVVEVPREKEDGPGFGVVMIILAMMFFAPVIRRRRE